MSEFKGKVVLVTGSSSGIGEGVAIEFAKLGAKVVITGRNEQKLKAVEKKCQDASPKGVAGKTVLSVVGDVTNDEDLQRLLKSTIAEFGQLDVLVNNAGTARFGNTSDPNAIQVYGDIMSLNLRSVFVMTHLAIPH